MYALIQNNEIVKTAGNARAFFPNTSFPAGGPSAKFLAGNGVVAVVDGERKDERFYWVTGTGLEVINGVPTRTYTNTPKDLDGLKAEWIAITKDTANKLLAPTDWYVIRKAERGTDIPAEVVETRAAIVAQCNEKEAAIQAATTVDELKEVVSRQFVVSEALSGNSD